jgi:hypothetical protein
MNTFYQSAERVLGEEHPPKELLVVIILKCSSKTNDLEFAEKAWRKLLQENPTIDDLCQAAGAKEPYIQEEVWQKIKSKLNKLDESIQFGYLVYFLRFINPLEKKAWIEISKYISNEKTDEKKLLDLMFVGEQMNGLDKKIWIQEECWSWIKWLWKNIPQEIADYIATYGWQTNFFKKMVEREIEDFFPQDLFKIKINLN